MLEDSVERQIGGIVDPEPFKTNAIVSDLRARNVWPYRKQEEGNVEAT